MTDFTGQSFDRYLLFEPLGEGGMATVYKAYDTRLERDVAVKIIRIDMFIPAILQQVLKRFEREAKSLAKLSHPNIVSIIDYGEHEGVPYLVMEYLPGGTLKNLLVDQRMLWQESFRLLLPVARALQFAHQQGVIHRDVKSSNILISLSGEPMLSDFGIAKILENEGNTGLTGTGVGIGTPEYMAPEQWVGKTSPQSDIYSLGVVLYEMTTGHKPFSADTPAAILLKQANDPLPRPREFVPDLPASVEKIILKALAKRPENRYQTMEEFIISMETLLSGQARIRQSVVPLDKPGVQKPAPVEPEALPIVQKLAPVEPEALSGEVPAEDQATLIVRMPVEQKPVEPPAPAVDPRVTKITMAEAHPHPMEVPQLPQVEPAGKKITLQLGALLRGKIRSIPVWILVLAGLFVLAGAAALTVLGVRRLTAQSVPTSVSDGYVYFTSDQSGKAEIYHLDPKGQVVRVTQTPGGYESWSPAVAENGTIYFSSNQSGKTEIYYLDSTGKLVQVTQTPGGYESWSPVPAGNGVVYFTSNQSGKAEIYYLDPTGKLVQVTQTPGRYESWSPFPAADGYTYFTSDQSGRAEVYYLDPSGKLVQFTHTPGGYRSWSPAPAANGIVYFTSDQSGKSEVYFLDSTGKLVQVTQSPGRYESWSPVPAAGGFIYFTSDQSGKAEVYYLDSRGSIHQVTSTPGRYKSWLLMFGRTRFVTKP
jgi:Tol biopolymer transport system component/tRNA A-37 threonylcarbamoyl transferase component Bud32